MRRVCFIYGHRCLIQSLSTAFMLVALGTRASTADVVEFEGIVKAVDPKSRSITVERHTPGGPKPISLDMTRKAGDLGVIQVGESLRITYDSDLEVVTGFKTSATDSPSSGTEDGNTTNAAILDLLDARIPQEGHKSTGDYITITERAGSDLKADAGIAYRRSYDLVVEFRVRQTLATLKAWGVDLGLPAIPGMAHLAIGNNAKANASLSLFTTGRRYAGEDGQRNRPPAKRCQSTVAFPQGEWHVIEIRARPNKRQLQVLLNGTEVCTESYYDDPYIGTWASVGANTSGCELDVRQWEIRFAE